MTEVFVDINGCYLALKNGYSMDEPGKYMLQMKSAVHRSTV